MMKIFEGNDIVTNMFLVGAIVLPTAYTVVGWYMLGRISGIW